MIIDYITIILLVCNVASIYYLQLLIGNRCVYTFHGVTLLSLTGEMTQNFFPSTVSMENATYELKIRNSALNHCKCWYLDDNHLIMCGSFIITAVGGLESHQPCFAWVHLYMNAAYSVFGPQNAKSLKSVKHALEFRYVQ